MVLLDLETIKRHSSLNQVFYKQLQRRYNFNDYVSF